MCAACATVAALARKPSPLSTREIIEGSEFRCAVAISLCIEKNVKSIGKNFVR